MKREPLLSRENEEKDLALAFSDYYFTKRVLKKGVAYHTSADVDAFIKQLKVPLNLPRLPAASEVYTDAYLLPLKERMPKP